MGKATDKMIGFATRIAEELDLTEDLEEILDNYDNFDEVSEFISENKSEYYESIK